MRYKDYTFKHTIDEHPGADQDNFVEHFHILYELLFFLSGDADFIIQQNRYKLRPYTLLVVKPGDHHNLVINTPQRYERIVLRFNGMNISPDLNKLLEKTDNAYNIYNSKVAEAIFRLDTHYEEIQGDLMFELFKSTLDEILIYLCCQKNTNQSAEQVNERVAQIISFIDSHLVDIHTLDDISSRLHMSKSTINKLFFEQVQTPIMSYVRTKKCMLAHSLLVKGEMATSVYSRCGFNDYSSFYRAYVKVFRSPPSGIVR